MTLFYSSKSYTNTPWSSRIKRVLTDRAMFKQWEKRYEAAQCQIDGRVEAMEACQDELERDLTMTGVTALEDKLQEGVGSALSHIRAAGIRV